MEIGGAILEWGVEEEWPIESGDKVGGVKRERAYTEISSFQIEWARLR